jgi:HEXXH motif-containing protein
MRDTLNPSYTGFSNPRESFDQPFFFLLASQYATCIIRMFLEALESRLNSAGVGLISQLTLFVSAEPSFEMIWSPALEQCVACLRSRDAISYRKVVADLLLHAAVRGMAGIWEVNLDEQSRFRWGRWTLPSCDRLSVASDGKTAQVSVRTQRGECLYTFHCESVHDFRWRSKEAGTPPRTSPGPSSFAILAETGVESESEHWLGAPTMALPSSAEHDAISAGLLLLKESKTSRYEWVVRILRSILLMGAVPQRQFRRKGDVMHLGMARLWDTAEPLGVAQALVDEASRQYFHLLTTLEVPIRVERKTQGYAPCPDWPRNVDRILGSYHALCNAHLFYEEYLEYCGNSEAVLSRLRALVARIKSIERFVTGSLDHLTPVGYSLVSPLIRLLRDAA